MNEKSIMIPSNVSTLGYIKILWHHLEKKRRNQIKLILPLIIVVSVLEFASIGLIAPFIGVLMDPDNYNKSWIIDFLSTTNLLEGYDHVFILTIVFVLTIILSSSMRMLLAYFNTITAFSIGGDINKKIYSNILQQPLEFHSNNNSSEIVSVITVKTNIVIFNFIFTLLQIITSSFLLLAIVTILTILEPVVFLSTIAIFSFIYLLLVLSTKRMLTNDGENIAYFTTKAIKSVQEGVGGIRDVILENTQRFRVKSFTDCDKPLRKSQGRHEFISQLPRPVVELIGILAITGIFYITVSGDDKLNSILPTLGLFVLGFQRMLPASQNIFHGWSKMRSSLASLNEICKYLSLEVRTIKYEQLNKRLTYNDKIEMVGVSFTYENSDKPIFKNLSLTIPKGAHVGIIGESGSGKSTTIDILMGLLSPSLGVVKVDGIKLEDNTKRNWFLNIAHVPQSIYLADISIEENIAFGSCAENIDRERIIDAAKDALIYDFIMSLPEKFSTRVGESGALLSGGQRQRIGIARALYKKADVLVLDEATNALDSNTEEFILGKIFNLDYSPTIIMVTHRVDSINKCGLVFKVKDGSVIVI